ncbi:hypothetical protein SBY92_002819 [Candida maltosa Xu316]
MKSIDKLFLWYFIIHIPVTILIDSSIVIPPEYQLSITKVILDFHISTNHDILLAHPQTWFKVFGAVEVVFQLPLFFYFVYKLLAGQLDVKYNLWCVIYGFNAAFTTLVCLVWIAVEGKGFGLSDLEILNLCGIYSPYLILPFILLVHSFRNIVSLKVKTD